MPESWLLYELQSGSTARGSSGIINEHLARFTYGRFDSKGNLVIIRRLGIPLELGFQFFGDTDK